MLELTAQRPRRTPRHQSQLTPRGRSPAVQRPRDLAETSPSGRPSAVPAHPTDERVAVAPALLTQRVAAPVAARRRVPGFSAPLADRDPGVEAPRPSGRHRLAA